MHIQIMHLNYSSDPLVESQNSHLMIGFFDGLHIGHQKLVDELDISARENLGPKWAISFYPHPLQLIKPELKLNLLFSREDLSLQLNQKGFAGLWLIPFTQDLSQLKDIDFLNRFIKPIKPLSITVGEDFRFGAKASGGAELLKNWGFSNNIKINIIKKLFVEGREVSSTWLRECLIQGDLSKANQLLGRNFSSKGVVVSGKKLARQLGFPTANIFPDKNFPLKHGVYKGSVKVFGKIYRAVINLGLRPTFAENEVVLEAHLLDFSGDLYGQVLEINWESRLRDEIKFSSLDELKKQIFEDIKRV